MIERSSQFAKPDNLSCIHPTQCSYCGIWYPRDVIDHWSVVTPQTGEKVMGGPLCPICGLDMTNRAHNDDPFAKPRFGHMHVRAARYLRDELIRRGQ